MIANSWLNKLKLRILDNEQSKGGHIKKDKTDGCRSENNSSDRQVECRP